MTGQGSRQAAPSSNPLARTRIAGHVHAPLGPVIHKRRLARPAGAADLKPMKNGFLLLFFFFGVVCAARAEQPIRHIPYLEFLTAVNEGKVEEVHFNNLMDIEGEMQTADGTVRFNTTRPMETGDDPLLLRFLEDRKIKITKSEQSRFQGPSAHLSGLFLTVIMFIIMVVVACLGFVQLHVLRRIEKKTNTGVSPPISGGGILPADTGDAPPPLGTAR